MLQTEWYGSGNSSMKLSPGWLDVGKCFLVWSLSGWWF